MTQVTPFIREPYATYQRPVDTSPRGDVVGTITVTGDPWSHVREVTLTSLDAPDDVKPVVMRVRGGAFRSRPQAGRYRVSAKAGRSLRPHELVEQRLSPEDGMLHDTWPVNVETDDVVVVEGETTQLELTVPDIETRTAVVLLPTVDGAPLPASWRGSTHLQWVDPDGSRITFIGWSDVVDGRTDDPLLVPAGAGRLAVSLWVDQGSLSKEPWRVATIDVVVPPAFDADGRSQALEVTVDLATPPDEDGG